MFHVIVRRLRRIAPHEMHSKATDPRIGERHMAHAQHRSIETNGINMHIAEQGEGPLVVLCDGFPECWYAWRHQLPALAEAGYHVVAPDQRGYGQR